jgi:acyl transferase domain-containing protein/acyl carrier protein
MKRDGTTPRDEQDGPGRPAAASYDGSEIAIIGMACRFPGASDVEQFWRNLRAGVESLTRLSDEELAAAGVPAELARGAGYVRHAPVLDGIELFDAAFFGYTPLEAKLMDPQHRLFLECAWEAFERAGYDPGRCGVPVGVFTGAKTNTYLFSLFSDRELFGSLDSFTVALGNDLAAMATRVSYKLDLRGPSYALHTACSTSLVAVHLACQSLLLGECRMALAGGAAINVPQRRGYVHRKGGLLSPDGSCRTFDAAAAGSNFGNGVGAVLLKRLEDALADGDHIHALIRGSATNNDGAAKASFTAPGVEGQTAVLLEAMACAGVDAASISYVEAHGTATELGDAIEMLALGNAFGAAGRRRGDEGRPRCAIGSVKTNLGHLETAAGVAGLIKTALALEHRQIPPSLHFERPNPKIDLAGSPFYVNTRLADWPAGTGPRRAGVSSFGIGSTNAHVIMEEAPAAPAPAPSRTWQLLALSARSAAALDRATRNLARHLGEQPEAGGQELADVAYTLSVGRKELAHRRVVVCRGRAEAAAALAELDPARVLTHQREAAGRSVAFLLPGLGEHYAGMGRDLYGHGAAAPGEPVFRAEIDRCAALLQPLLGLDLREVLYPPAAPAMPAAGNTGLDLRRMVGREERNKKGAAPGAAGDPGRAGERLDHTWLAQPALFAVEYALAQLWISWGVRPQAMIGYSLGEFVAACLAGVLTLPDALRLVAERARLIEGLPGGGMLAVALAEAALAPLLVRHRLSLAAVNGVAGCVAAGSAEGIAALERELGERDVVCRRLPTTHPFHAAELAALAAPLTELARTIALAPPQIPYFSNVTGDWIAAEQATDPGYWARHMCQPVRFADAVTRLLGEGRRVLLEVGPGQGLGSFVRQHPDCGDDDARAIFASLRNAYGRQGDLEGLLGTLGKLWLVGQPIDWTAFWAGERRRRVPLPTYPFERQRYWVDPPRADWGAVEGVAPAAAAYASGATVAGTTAARAATAAGAASAGAGASTGAGRRVTLDKQPDPADWLYQPVWRQTAPPAAWQPPAAGEAGGAGGSNDTWLVIGSEHPLGAALAARLRESGCRVLAVTAAAAGAAAVLPPAGADRAALAAGSWQIDPAQPAHYQELLAALESGTLDVLHLWSATPAPAGGGSHERLQELGFYSLLFLAQALGRRRAGQRARIAVVSSELQRVTGGEEPVPDKATLLGPCRVIPQELAGVSCRSIDVEPIAAGGTGEAAHAELAGWLLAEVTEAADLGDATVVAYRGGSRWVQDFVRVAPPADGDEGAKGGLSLREKGVYLLTGGLGGIGLALAEHLARTVRARLVLTGRSPLPPEAEWDDWLAGHPPDDRVSGRLRQLRRLAALGAEVMAVAVDATDESGMREVVAAARRRFGAIHGVVHLAGAPGGGIIQLKTRAAAARIMAPKIAGTRVLEALFPQPGELDFLVLFSSIASILGELGQADYCGANAYLDAVAQRNAARGWPPTVTVDSDIWREVGLAVHTEVPAHLRAMREEMLAQALTPPEGAAAFGRALRCGVPQVVISAQPLAGRIELGKSFTGQSFLAELERRQGAAHPPRAAPAVLTVDGESARRVLGTGYVGATGAYERRIAEIWQRQLGIEQVGVHDNFFDLGGNSLLGLQVVAEISRELGVEVAPVTLFESPTVAALARQLAPSIATAAGAGGAAPLATLETAAGPRRPRQEAAGQGAHDIAVIAMTGRFPGAPTVEQLWRNLRAGVESVRFFATEELIAAGVDPALAADPRYVRAGAILDGVDLFDAGLFGFSPREAEVTDPQHRIFLECAWEVLERAGYDPSTYPGAIGVFAGANLSTYLLRLYADPQVKGAVNMLQAILGNDKDSLTTTVSYKLDLRGPSVAVQTFCSTSLVAVHMACRSLRGGECEMALAGGVRIVDPDRQGYLYEQGGLAPSDGHSRSFDAGANGSVLGHGAAVVCLKRLEDALADGDPVLAVIKGSAINNDGAEKAGYTAPSVNGQAAAIAAAFVDAGVEPDSVSYVEAHGSATELGDPIEIAALTKAFRRFTRRAGWCPIGSVKSNFGHLDRAAGVTGLIKTVLALEHGEIPPSINFERPNPQIDFAASPFFVNAELRPWERGEAPRRAGVNSLGMGGTNVHVVVEEAPPLAPGTPSRPWQLLVLSAKTPAALEGVTDGLRRWLDERPDLDARALADACYTLKVGRRALPYRRALVCRDAADAAAALASGDPGRLLSADSGERSRPVVFAFAGLGGQYAGMGRGLYESEPAFRAAVDECAAALELPLGLDLRRLLYPAEGGAAGSAGSAGNGSGGGNGSSAGNGSGAGGGIDGEVRGAALGAVGGIDGQIRGAGVDAGGARPAIDLRRMLGRAGGGQEVSDPLLDETRLAQPALFVVEYALARLLMEWGIRPQAVLGYSLGEYTAACIAGVLSLSDALALVAGRARLIGELPPGAMLAAALPAAELRPQLGPELSLAAVNGPAQSVAAGAPEAVDDLAARLAARGVACRRLRTTHAFHSRQMEAIFERAVELAAGVELRPPAIPCLSNVTGTWLSAEEATDPTYWARHMCQPVRFSEAIAELRREPDRVVVEIGPGQALGSLILQHPASRDGEETAVLAAMRHSYETQPAGSDQAYALGALARLWLLGVTPDWQGFYAHERRRRVLLPTYPFERKRYWIETADPAAARRADAGGARLAERTGGGPAPEAHLYVPSWKRVPLAAARAGSGTAAKPSRAAGAASNAGNTTSVSDASDARNARDARDARDSRDSNSALWLLLGGDDPGRALAQRLARAGRRVARVRTTAAEAAPAGGVARIAPGLYEIDAHAAGAFEALLAALGETPGHVVHLWSGEQDETPESAAEGYAALLSLAAAFAARGQDGNAQAPPRFFLLTREAQAIEDGESPRPEAAVLAGIRAALDRRLPGCACRVVDVRLTAPGSAAGERLLKQLAAELAGSTAEPLVAYRGTHRWMATLEELADGIEDGAGPASAAAAGGGGGIAGGSAEVSADRLGAAEDSAAWLAPPPLVAGGAYLVAGGLEPAGFGFAAFLARRARARLVLVEPPGFPGREEWDDWLAGGTAEGVIAGRIRRARRLEALGAELLVAGIDAADDAAVRGLVERAEQRWGALAGLVHVAGWGGEDAAGLTAGMRALRALDGVRRRSGAALAWLVTPPGNVALRLFADALAERSAEGAADGAEQREWDGEAGAPSSGPAAREPSDDEPAGRAAPWTSILWGLPPADEDDDDANASNPASPGAEARRAAGAIPAVGSAASSRALRRLLALGGDCPQVVVSPRPLPAGWSRLDDLPAAPLASAGTEEDTPARGAGVGFYPRPSLRVAYAAPRGELETFIGRIWEELLGVAKVGIHDNFLDLGGDSLLATRLVARMRDALQLELPVRLFFERSTVSELAAAVEEIRREQQSAETRDLVDSIRGMSEEELEMEILRLERAVGSEEVANG